MLGHENPYRSPRASSFAEDPAERLLREGARGSLQGRGLLYRRVLLEAPVEAVIEFHGRGLRDVVRLDGRIAAWRVSWWRITPRLDFTLPAAGVQLPVTVELRIWPWLAMRAFRIRVAGAVAYAEGDGRVWERKRARRRRRKTAGTDAGTDADAHQR